MKGLRRRRATGNRRGYSLIELMAVIVIIGILAALAIVGYRKYTASAGTTEALAVIQGIRNAEESYKAETLVYLGCSGCGGAVCPPGGGDLSTWFPQSGNPTSGKVGWNNTGAGHADAACWQMLNVVTDGPVRFGYAVVAGIGSPIAPAGIQIAKPPNPWPTTTEPWFVVQAAGDRDNNGVFALAFATSFKGEIYVENEAE